MQRCAYIKLDNQFFRNLVQQFRATRRSFRDDHRDSNWVKNNITWLSKSIPDRDPKGMKENYYEAAREFAESAAELQNANRFFNKRIMLLKTIRRKVDEWMGKFRFKFARRSDPFDSKTLLCGISKRLGIIIETANREFCRTICNKAAQVEGSAA